MQKIWVVVAAFAAAMAVSGGANAVTIGPAADPSDGTHVDASDFVHRAANADDARVNTVDIAGHSGCLLNETTCDLPALTVGRTYRAVITDSGQGGWDCSTAHQQINCDWVYPRPNRREYVFTYTGQPQTLTPYYAPATVAITKTARRHSWDITCSATRAGTVATGKPVRIEWRTAKHPRWRSLRKMTTANNGSARAVLSWNRPRGSVRCVSDADWHTQYAASRVVRIHSR